MPAGTGSPTTCATNILALASIAPGSDAYVRLLGVISKVIEIERREVVTAISEAHVRWYDDRGAQTAIGELLRDLTAKWELPNS